MIKNEREYKITKSAVAKLESAIAHITKLRKNSKTDARKNSKKSLSRKGSKSSAIEPWQLSIQKRATLSMLEDLHNQLKDYEELRRGKFQLSVLDILETLPLNLIRARIALGWTQKELARRIKTTEQQIQKYEASNYESASLKKIVEISHVLQQQNKHASKQPSGSTTFST